MAKYYDDHLAAAEKDISSRNFCNLVDAAVMLYEEEEASTSSSVVTRRNLEQSHQNLNGASTSSSVPVDSDPYQCIMINDYHLATAEEDMISSRNMCNEDAARLYGEKKLKGKSKRHTKTLFEEEEEEDEEEEEEEEDEEEEETDTRNFHLFLRKRRTTSVKNPVPQENLNGASTSCKRKRSGGKAKKAKVAPFSWKERAPPECLTQMMNHMKGPQRLYEITQGPRLILDKKQTKTDVTPNQGRLLMPLKTLIRNDFLTPVELGIIDDKKGVGAVLVNQQNVTWNLTLVRREMKKKSGKGTSNYALNCGWNDIVKGNGLKEDDDISIWSFRCQEVLCFALVLPPSPDMAQSSSSLPPCP